MSLMNNKYKSESTCGSNVLISSASNLYPKRNYYIINPFTKSCTFRGSLDIGDCGIFELLKNVQQKKYHWATLKHVYAEFQAIFLFLLVLTSNGDKHVLQMVMLCHLKIPYCIMEQCTGCIFI